MRNLLSLPLKHKIVTGGVVVAMAAGGVTAALSQPQSTGADTSPLVQQVNHNTEQLDNHEDRISNNERDVKDLQNKTSTSSNSSNVTPRSVNTAPSSQPVTNNDLGQAPAQAPAPTPDPRTITRIFKGVNAGVITCKYELYNGETTAPVQVQGDCLAVGEIAP